MKRDGRCAEKHTPSSAPAAAQTSVDPHASKLPLTVCVLGRLPDGKTHSNISALQLQKQLGIGSYRSAWPQLRASMVDPERNPLSGLVEIDEGQPLFRTKDDPPTGGQGRSHDGKMLIVGAIELGEKHCGWPKSPLRRPRTLVETAIRSRRHRENRRLVATLRSPPIATMSMSSGRPPLTSSFPPSLSNLKGWARGVYHVAASQASAGLSR